MKSDKLTKEEHENLLKLARHTIEKKLFGKSDINIKTDYPIFNEERAVFVTLHKKGDLRGCIGQIFAQTKLITAINEMALASAFDDPRFPSLSKDEYSEIDIEISVLSPITEVNSWKDIVVGEHGIIISKGYHKGVLLPQVATEYNWDTETFIKHGCMKAGLPQDEYLSGVKVQVFSADVFGEKTL